MIATVSVIKAILGTVAIAVKLTVMIKDLYLFQIRDEVVVVISGGVLLSVVGIRQSYHAG